MAINNAYTAIVRRLAHAAVICKEHFKLISLQRALTPARPPARPHAHGPPLFFSLFGHSVLVPLAINNGGIRHSASIPDISFAHGSAARQRRTRVWISGRYRSVRLYADCAIKTAGDYQTRREILSGVVGLSRRLPRTTDVPSVSTRSLVVGVA